MKKKATALILFSGILISAHVAAAPLPTSVLTDSGEIFAVRAGT